jgi:biopolymer transport protein ExbB
MGFEIIEFVKNHFAHVAPIVISGTIAVAIILERYVALYLRYPLRNEQGFFDRLRELVMADQMAEAVAFCERYGSKPVAQVAKRGLMRASQPEDMIESGLIIAVQEQLQKIEKRTSILGMIANVATLLGLLGTIAGLIDSFKAVGSADAAQKTALLAQGISTAMNATMLGLGVAIPCMVMFSLLMNRTNALLAAVETTSTRVMDLVKQRHLAAERHAQGGAETAMLRKAG